MLSYLFGGKKSDKKENENAELAMREALDEHEEFHCEEDGCMNFDDYIVALANGTTGENQLHLFTAP